MAEQIGIKLALDGAGAVQSGLRSVSDALGNLGTRTVSVADAFRGLAPTIAATFSVGAITAWARGAVNAIDAMNDLADATGATVEQISALDGFARKTGTTLDSVGGILVKFNAVLNQTGADNGVSQALRAIGLDTVALRRADPVQALQQTAQALANYADDANKARLVQELFGKSIREAAPILKDLADAGQLNATVTARQAAEAEKFNRAMAQFSANAQDAGRAVVNALLPGLNDLLQRLNAARDAFGSLGEFFQAAMTGQGLFNFRDPVAGYQEYTRRIAELDSKLADTRVRRSAYELQGLRKQREELERYQSYYGSLANMQGAFGAGAGRGGDPRALAERPSVPTLPTGPAPDPLSAIRDPRAQYRAEFLRSEKAAYAELDRERERQLEDARKRDAGYAEYQLQLQDEVTRTLIEHEQMVADYMRQQDEARQAELRIRADQDVARQARVDEANNRADDAARRAAQERLDADARESLATAQRYDDAVNAAEEAYRRQSASYAEYVLSLRDDTTRALIALEEYQAAWLTRDDEERRRREAAYAEYLLTLGDDTTRTLIELQQYETEWLKRDDEDRRKREASYAEYLLEVQDDVTRTQISNEQALKRYLDDNTEARTRALQTLGDRIAQMRVEAQATELAAQQSISLAEAIEQVAIARLREQQSMYREGSEGWRAVQAEIDARLELLRLMGDERVRDANLRAAQDAANAWQRTVDQISQSLADALMNGGMKAGEALKNYFRTLILQPIIRAAVDPIARGITGALGLAGAAGPAAASGGGGGLGGIGSIFSGLSSIGSSLSFIGSGASMTLAGQAIPAFQAAGAAMSGGSIGAGLGIGLGAALPFLALGGILAMGFSRKLKDQGIQGTFGPGGFTGNEFKFYKGGFLTSDKTVLRGLPDDVRVMLSDGFNALRTGTAQMARELGLASESLDTFTKDIKLSFMGLTQEQIQQKLAQELGLVADEMARLVAGSDATADSLRQLYQAVMSERAQLEQRLLQLQGDTTELRRRERDNLHETNRALFDRIVALEDEQAALEEVKRAAAEAAQALAQQIATLQGELQQAEAQRLSIAQAVVSERTALEQRLLQAQGNTAALRERELQALDPLNRAFARMVYAAEDAAQATAGAAQNLAALAGAGQGISEFVAGLRASGSGNAASLASLRATYSRTLALAQAGDVAASSRITGDARALIDAGRATARTRAEADALAARIATELAALPAAVNYERQQAESLQALLTHATQVDKAAQDSIDSNTFDTAAETEKTVDEMRALVAATVVNSSSLVTLNENIGLLTNQLRQATEEQKRQQEAEITRQANLQRAALLNQQGTRQLAQATEARTSAQGALSGYQSERVALKSAVDQLLGIWEYGSGKGSHQAVIRAMTGIASVPTNTQSGSEVQRLGWAQQILAAGQQSTSAFSSKGRSGWEQAISAFVAEMGDNDGLSDYRAIDQQISSYSGAVDAANKLIADLEALRAQVRALGAVPAFATGGLHTGGLRLVGERGPELEVTGPARYWSAADTTAMLGNGQRREELLAAEIRALRAEVAGLRTEARVTAVAANKTQRLWERVTRDGESMQVTDVTPAP